MKKLCALLGMKFFSQQDDTKIVNFDEGIFILCLFFWGKRHKYWKFPIVWFLRVKCLLLLCIRAKPV